MDEFAPQEPLQPVERQPVQLKPNRKPSPVKVVFGAIWYLLVLSIIFVVATGASWIQRSPLAAGIVADKIKDSVGLPNPTPSDIFHSDTVTLLVLGCDQNVGDTYSYGWKEAKKREFYRTGVRPHISRNVRTDSARTDMMMVVKLDLKNHTIAGLSIPRDLEVELPGYRAQKINGYYSYGKGDKLASEQLTKEAVQSVLPGVSIDRVVTLDYEAFQNVVDLVGGVPVDIDKDLKYVDVGADLWINLKKGQQVLDGYNAMCFVRFRHTDSDFKRQERQKALLVSLKGEILHGNNIGKIPEIIEQAKHILGETLSDDEIRALISFGQDVPSTNIKLGMVPVVESRRSTNLLLDSDKLPEAMNEFGLGPDALNLTPAIPEEEPKPEKKPSKKRRRR